MSDYPVVMAIHAAISRRNWNEVERAANNLRDYEQPKWKQAADRIAQLEAALRDIAMKDMAIMNKSTARIEALEAALREIKDQHLSPDQSSAIAKAALAPEQDK